MIESITIELIAEYWALRQMLETSPLDLTMRQHKRVSELEDLLKGKDIVKLLIDLSLKGKDVPVL